MPVREGAREGAEEGVLQGPNFGNAATELNATTGLTFDQVWPGVVTGQGANAHDLVAQGGALDNQSTSGLKAGNGISEVAFALPDDDPDQGFDCTDSTIGDPGTSTLYLIVVELENTNPGATLTHWGKRRKSGDFGGVVCTTATGGTPLARIDVGTGAGVTASLSTDHYDGNWHTIAVLVDQNAGTISIASETDAAASTAFTSDVETNTEVLTLGEHRLDSAQGNYALFAVAQGAQVEGLDIKTLCDDVHAEMVA